MQLPNIAWSHELLMLRRCVDSVIVLPCRHDVLLCGLAMQPSSPVTRHNLVCYKQMHSTCLMYCMTCCMLLCQG